jgi:UDP:flavonoid glycosyltransferase YjiC (YdhE family)
MIVLFPSCAFLSEVTRMIAIHKALRARGEDVRMATHGGPYEDVLRDEGIAYDLVAPTMNAARCQALVRSVPGVSQVDTPLYSEAEVRALVAGEVAYLREKGARAVVSGFALTTLLSSRVANIPLVTDHAGSFVGPAMDRGLLPAPARSPIPLVRFFPEVIRRFLANQGPMRVKHFGKELNQVAAELGVEGVPSLAALLSGDLTLVTDIPEMVGISKEDLEGWVPKVPAAFRPGTAMRYTGPLFANLSCEVPADVARFLDRARPHPLVYVAITSSSPELVRHAVGAARSAGARVIVAATEHDVDDLAGDDVCVAKLLPSPQIFPRVDLGIIAGGQGSVQTALACGAPFVGLPLQPEQDWNVVCAERVGAALRVDPRRASSPELSNAVRTLLTGETATRARAAAGRIRELFAKVDGPARAAEAIVEYLAARAPHPPLRQELRTTAISP